MESLIKALNEVREIGVNITANDFTVCDLSLRDFDVSGYDEIEISDDYNTVYIPTNCEVVKSEFGYLLFNNYLHIELIL